MEWRDFILPIYKSKISSSTSHNILRELFTAGKCKYDFSEATAKSWLAGNRNCKVSAYFPDGEIDRENVFHYFRKRPDSKLRRLQQLFQEEADLDPDSPIDMNTDDLDVFCWSLVNQFLDLLGFQRADISDSPNLSGSESVNAGQSCEKCCLYCIHWHGNKSNIGPHRMPTRGTCKTRSGKNKIHLHRPLSSSAVCKDYQADQDLISNMKRIGYNVENLM